MDTTTNAIAKLIAEARKRARALPPETPPYLAPLNWSLNNWSLNALADTLEAVTRERDNLLRRRDSDDLTINQVCAERAAVTKERDALAVKLDDERATSTLSRHTLHQEIAVITKESDALRDRLDKLRYGLKWMGESGGRTAQTLLLADDALASRDTPQEPNDNAK